MTHRLLSPFRFACWTAPATLLLLFLVIPALAEDVYISQSSLGSGTGVDCSNARSATWFNTPGNWASPKQAGKIGPGDTVHVCGELTGAANASILTFQGSGTSGNPITLKFETGAGLSAPYCASWVSGAGCITMSNSRTPRSYLIVDGGTPCGWNTATNTTEGTCNGYIVNTDNGSGLTYNNYSSGIEMDTCTNCEVKNMAIYNIVQTSAGNCTGLNAQQQSCINFSGSNNSIHDSTFHDAGGVWATPSGTATRTTRFTITISTRSTTGFSTLPEGTSLPRTFIFTGTTCTIIRTSIRAGHTRTGFIPSAISAVGTIRS